MRILITTFILILLFSVNTAEGQNALPLSNQLDGKIELASMSCYKNWIKVQHLDKSTDTLWIKDGVINLEGNTELRIGSLFLHDTVTFSKSNDTIRLNCDYIIGFRGTVIFTNHAKIITDRYNGDTKFHAAYIGDKTPQRPVRYYNSTAKNGANGGNGGNGGNGRDANWKRSAGNGGNGTNGSNGSTAGNGYPGIKGERGRDATSIEFIVKTKVKAKAFVTFVSYGEDGNNGSDGQDGGVGGNGGNGGKGGKGGGAWGHHNAGSGGRGGAGGSGGAGGDGGDGGHGGAGGNGGQLKVDIINKSPRKKDWYAIQNHEGQGGSGGQGGIGGKGGKGGNGGNGADGGGGGIFQHGGSSGGTGLGGSPGAKGKDGARGKDGPPGQAGRKIEPIIIIKGERVANEINFDV